MGLNIVLVLASYYVTIRTAYKYLVKKHNYTKFFISLIANVIGFSIGLWFVKVAKYELLFYFEIPSPKGRMDIYEIFENRYFWFIIQMVIVYFALLCVPVTAKFFRDQMRQQQKEMALQKQNMRLQMDFLKAQIHPHFLFNTLNNIYSLNLAAQSEKASQMISKLSSLLRYVLYQGKDEFIALENELKMLQDFINLEAIRSDNLDLTLDFPEEVSPEIYLPPFLLLPLVENAFKHGVNAQLDRSFVHISLRVSTAFIQLEVGNSFDKDYRHKNAGGLGLSSLKQRLQYYYPKSYKLTITEKENQYTTQLQIPLQCPKFTA